MSELIPLAVRLLISERSQGVCERCCMRRATQIHHRCARKMGGSEADWINRPDNLVHLCGSSSSGCHGFATTYAASARADGWVVHQGVAEREGPFSVLARDTHDRYWRFNTDGSKQIELHYSPIISGDTPGRTQHVE